MHKRYLFPSVLGSLLLLAACSVDTTGLSPDSNRKPHPSSNANSTVLVEEFIDLECEACRAAQTQIIPQLLEQYGSKMRFEVKHFPIGGGHIYSIYAAQAAECAADQGKFWEFEELDYKNQPDLNKEAVYDWARELRLDMPLFERCLKSEIKKNTVLADKKEGEERGVNGTPTFFVNGKKVESRIQAIGAAIQEAASGSAMRL
jgi:protein-disulfide isomerase